MYRNVIYLLLAITPITVFSQNMWTKINERDLQVAMRNARTLSPSTFETYSLNTVQWVESMRSVPHENSVTNIKNEGFLITLPTADGKIIPFRIVESPVLSEGIALKYPSIKTYKGVSVDQYKANVRLSVTPQGIHAVLWTPNGEQYIDPYVQQQQENFIVYYTRDYPNNEYSGIPICGNSEEEYTVRPTGFNPSKRFTEQVEIREYRLAMACTGEWGTRRGTVEKALSDIAVMTNRMNLIYEQEFAIRFKIIDDNDKIIFLDPDTDPYSNSDEGRRLVGINTSRLNAIIPSNSYDVGHVLSVCFDIGGVAQLGSACQSNKGNGVTCHNNSDLTTIVTRVMAHEVGHQFDASHTWNRCTSAADQRASNTAYEPGSGTTIMSYAGTCGTDNVAGDNDAYFHIASIEQITDKSTSGGNAYGCAQKTLIDNHFPVVTVPTKTYVIPVSTPFELSGSASDEDGDALTYVWEQYDNGPESPLGEPNTLGPLFRSVKPSATGDIRFFPNAPNILQGRLNEKNEVLPTVTRNLNFKLTVRDNNINGGGVSVESYGIQSNDNAGPFEVTYPRLDGNFKIGEEITVTWDVANTDQAPINCKTVNIYASYNTALRNDDPNLVPLALGVANDGAQEVVIPNQTSNFVRFVVKAADNIFLASGILPSRIQQPTEPTVYFELPASSLTACVPLVAEYTIATQGLGGLTEDISFDVTGLPVGAEVSFEPATVTPGQSTKMILDLSNVVGDQITELRLKAIAGAQDTLERVLSLNLVSSRLDDIDLLAPDNGAVGLEARPTFEWTSLEDADNYRFQLSENPAFDSDDLIANNVTNLTTFSPQVILDKSKIYFWRVNASNTCRDGEWTSIRVFSTEALSCAEYTIDPLNEPISGSGTPTVEIKVNVPIDGAISDLNIKTIAAEHTRPSDIEAYLVAPDLTEVTLFKRKCPSNQNINVGLDDQSPQFFTCPINLGRIYRPEGKLSDFNGKNQKGEWTLRFDDKSPGSGGRLTSFIFEICSNVALDPPFIINNNILDINPLDNLPIKQDLLLAGDNNNSANEIQFIITSIPQKGILTVNGQLVSIGDVLTQSDINAESLKYKYTGTESNDTDSFEFVVTDGEGGFVPISMYNINIDAGIPSSTQNVRVEDDIIIYPNPTSDQVQINTFRYAAHLKELRLKNLSGQVINNYTIHNGQLTVDLSTLNSGVYIFEFIDNSSRIGKKVIKL